MNFLASSSDSGSGVAAGVVIFVIAVAVITIAAMWKVFTKAGEEGWKAIIPIYNYYVLLKIVGRPGWWLLLYFIPVVNLIIAIIVLNDLSKSFGKGVGFTFGLFFLLPIFILILGFGDARYVGPGGQPAMAYGTPPPPPPAGMAPPPPPPPTS
jgi:hypothetical protein